MFANEACHRMSELEENVYSIFFFIFKAQKCIFISCADKMFFVIFISFHIFIKCPIIKNKDNNGG